MPTLKYKTLHLFIINEVKLVINFQLSNLVKTN